MKRAITLILILVLLPTLTACGVIPFSNLKAVQKDVEEYNQLIDATLENYVESTKLVKEQHQNLIDYLTKDEEWGMLESLNTLPEPLTPEQSTAFNLYGVIYDEHFTALGSQGIREVLILKGRKHTMYATILWGKYELISIDRVVVEQ